VGKPSGLRASAGKVEVTPEVMMRSEPGDGQLPAGPPDADRKLREWSPPTLEVIDLMETGSAPPPTTKAGALTEVNSFIGPS
jgi:hypothetical protein